jgi:hypothetical protein
MDKPLPDYRLVLRPEASTIPAAIRLRRALKYLGRVCGLKCLSAEEIARDEPNRKAPKPCDPQPASGHPDAADAS